MRDGKPVRAQDVMLKSTGGYPMASKASGTELLIMYEKDCFMVALIVTSSHEDLRIGHQQSACDLRAAEVCCTHSCELVTL